MKNLKVLSLAALILGAVLSTSCSDLISEKNYSEYGSVSIFTGERAVFVEEIKSAKAKIHGFDSAGKEFTEETDVLSVSSGSGTLPVITGNKRNSCFKKCSVRSSGVWRFCGRF